MLDANVVDLSLVSPDKNAPRKDSEEASSPPRIAPVFRWSGDSQPHRLSEDCSAKLSALQLLDNVSRNHLASNLAFSLSCSSLGYFVGYHHLQFERVVELCKHLSIEELSQRGRTRLAGRSRIRPPSILPLDYQLVRLLSDIDSLLSDLPQYAFKPKQEKEIYQEKFKELAGHQQGLAQALSQLRRQDWLSLSPRDFVSLATDRRLSSTALQLFVEQEGCSAGLLSLLEASKAELIRDKLGCHVVRRAIPKSQAFASSLAQLVQPSIVELACNEYSSRVLQALALADPSFACSFLRSFLDHWKQLSGHISAVFLFSVCLQLLPKPDPTAVAVGEQLLQLAADPMNGRYSDSILDLLKEWMTNTWSTSLVYF